MIIAIVGPTGIGKTALSIALAKKLNTEIISGDSVQIYKGMNIGSGKATTNEMQGIKHHLIDVLEPQESFSVALFQTLVRNKIQDFEQRGITPLIVGGTGLYIKSVLYDYNFEDAQRDPQQANKYKSYSNDDLYQILLDKDPAAATIIHRNNRKRVIQAIIRSASNKMSDNTNKDVPLYDFIIIGLRLERNILYERINNRVDAMIDAGLEEEVKRLYEEGLSATARQAIGYKEWIHYFNGEWTKEQTVDKIKQHSRNLAKKQYTFFEHQFPVRWFDVSTDDFEQTIQQVTLFLHKEGVL